jgi:hypothetical protein
MENKILSYFEKLRYLNDLSLIAAEMRNMLDADMGSLKPDSTCESQVDNLDLALIRYFCRREHRYAIRLLDHYIATGNTDMPDTCKKENHHPERFNKIHALISELFTGIMLPDGVVTDEEITQIA